MASITLTEATAQAGYNGIFNTYHNGKTYEISPEQLREQALASDKLIDPETSLLEKADTTFKLILVNYAGTVLGLFNGTFTE